MAQPKIKLYWLEKSRAQSILWLLEELKLEYELELFHRNKDTMLAPPELKQIHALGKSPVISITPSDAATTGAKPVVIAETGFITQYLCEHFAKDGQSSHLMPARYREGQEGKAGGETEQWMRWQYFLHYTEGSLMPVLIMAMVLGQLKGPKIPFFVRPLTTMIANQIFSAFIFPNAKTHLAFLEHQITTSGGDYMCGTQLSAADIVLAFGLVTGKDQFSSFGRWEQPPEKQYPKLWAWMDRMEKEPGYEKSVEKIKTIDSSYGVKFP
ncbi:Glutathione S-transferase 1 [Apiospora saccharicola]|uniref:Glutathione S-transferase 1 n=1 Tax=Apiospora saccharicola TaxID=335842 RepID=A0ABR1TLC2_9PEZI